MIYRIWRFASYVSGAQKGVFHVSLGLSVEKEDSMSVYREHTVMELVSNNT